MSSISCKGGIRNKKVINYFEKYLYPDIKVALAEVSTSLTLFIQTMWVCIVNNDNPRKRRIGEVLGLH